jgi:tRNA(fMet)-specific endonuclease VapC
MLQFMMDTNICIYVMKNRLRALGAKFEAEQASICISAITLAELYFGAENSDRVQVNVEAIERFTGGLRVLSFGVEAAAHFGAIRAHLKRAGTPVSPQDMLIGAHARSEGLTLVTNNRREFDRISGLQVENWV